MICAKKKPQKTGNVPILSHFSLKKKIIKTEFFFFLNNRISIPIEIFTLFEFK